MGKKDKKKDKKDKGGKTNAARMLDQKGIE